MKKYLITLFITVCCLLSPVYAESDIQLGIGTPVFTFSSSKFDLKNACILSINLSNHNFLGNESKIGFSEAVTFAPITSDFFKKFPGFNMSAFVGPAFKISQSEKKYYVLSAGFKYFMNYGRNVSKYTVESSNEMTTTTGTKIYSAYAASIDFQMKFSANKRCSFVMGIPASLGIGNENFTEQVTSSNSNSFYKELKSKGKIEPFLEMGFPYFMLCINFF